MTRVRVPPREQVRQHHYARLLVLAGSTVRGLRESPVQEGSWVIDEKRGESLIQREPPPMRKSKVSRSLVWVVGLCLVLSLMLPGLAEAKTAAEIDAAVDKALARFKAEVRGSEQFLEMAKGVLAFAGVIKAGAGIGGEYGEGALRIGGRTVAYYSITSASIGFQFGVQRRDIIIVFLQERALSDFRAKRGWQVGVDGSIVFVDVGASASIDTTKLNQPIVAFVVGQRGLMYNLTLEGSKITQLQK